MIKDLSYRITRTLQEVGYTDQALEVIYSALIYGLGKELADDEQEVSDLAEEMQDMDLVADNSELEDITYLN